MIVFQRDGLHRLLGLPMCDLTGRDYEAHPVFGAFISQTRARMQGVFRHPFLDARGHDFEYCDQMHLVHDFAEFSGGTPSKALAELETVFVDPIKTMRKGLPQMPLPNSLLIL